MAERRGPEEGSDDLFDDLDKFFQSVDEEEWPEPIGSGSGPPAGSPPAREPRSGPNAAPEPEVPAAHEPEPASPFDSVFDAPAASEPPPGPAEVAPPTAAAVHAGAGPDAEAPQPSTPPAPPSRPGSRGEMTPGDWSRLRDVLREEDEEEDERELEIPGRGPSAEESLFGYAGPAGNEEESAAMSDMWETGGSRRGPADEDEDAGPGAPLPGPERELTLDDLRKAPPEYRNLPAPLGEEPGDRTPPPRPGPVDAGLEGTPSLADVEAAADRVAGEFAAAAERSAAERATGAPEGSEPEPVGSVGGPAGEWGPGGGATGGGLGAPPGGAAPGDRGSPNRWLDEGLGEPSEPTAPEDDLLVGRTETPERRKVKVGDPEALLGPAWEDPTARTVGREPPQGPRTGRNIPLAVVSAAVLAVLAFLFVLISPWLFTILAGGVVLVGQYELYTTSQKRGYHPAIALGLVTGGLTVAAAYFKGEPAMAFMLGLTTVLTFLWYMASPAKARAGTLANIGVTILGVVYLPFMASFIVLILTQANSGKGLMLGVLGLTFLYDVAAFVIGSWYGTHPLAPTISPKKSWEGLIGATFTTIVISMAFVSQVGPMTLMRAIGLALVVCVFAPLGDLAESVVKRDLGVKDMGSIMPGHGGMLDRIDSVLFVAPAAFYFLRVIF